MGIVGATGRFLAESVRPGTVVFVALELGALGRPEMFPAFCCFLFTLCWGRGGMARKVEQCTRNKAWVTLGILVALSGFVRICRV